MSTLSQFAFVCLNNKQTPKKKKKKNAKSIFVQEKQAQSHHDQVTNWLICFVQFVYVWLIDYSILLKTGCVELIHE